MIIEVLDLTSVGSGWTIEDYNVKEKRELAKENAYHIFKTKKNFIKFTESESKIMEEFEKFESIENAIEYLSDLNYMVKVNR